MSILRAAGTVPPPRPQPQRPSGPVVAPLPADQTSSGVAAAATGPAPAKPAPRVAVAADPLIFTVDADVGELRLLTWNRMPETTPTVRLTPQALTANDPGGLAQRLPHIAQELRSGLERTLTEPMRTTGPGPEETFLVRISVPLRDAHKNELIRSPTLLPVRISLRTELAGAEPVEHVLQLELRNAQFNYWLALDFGTSNCTVTAWDTKRLGPPGLAPEQRDVLQRQLQALLQAGPEKSFPGRPDLATLWQRYRDRLDNVIGPSGGGLEQCLQKSDTFYFAVREIERRLSEMTLHEEFFRIVSLRLYDAYEAAFTTPVLETRFIHPVPVNEGNQTCLVSSFMEIEDRQVEGVYPLSAQLSEVARQHYASEIATSGTAELARRLSRFVPSPKLIQNTSSGVTMWVADRDREVTWDRLMQAGWARLIGLFDEARERTGSYSPGPVREVVITYPTTASPSVREAIPGLMQGIGCPRSATDFDEAVAVAMFHLRKEIGDDVGVGIQGFRSRCRQVSTDGDKIFQRNMLVIDIGGGTTDIALIEFRLTEKNPLAGTPDAARAGRYYELTPSLLASTGAQDLGGERMTLAVFHLLKAAIAEAVLSALRDGAVREAEDYSQTGGNLARRLRGLDERFRAGESYRAGSIMNLIGAGPEEPITSGHQSARDAAGLILPTRWADDPSDPAPRHAFWRLWEMAEKLKQKLGSKVPQQSVDFPGSDITQLLREAWQIDLEVTDYEALTVTLRREQIEAAISPVVTRAADLAANLLTSCKAPLDRLILSGQSCNLELVWRKLSRALERDYPAFPWNNDTVIFRPEYAKSATSIGACYAHALQRYVFEDPEHAIPTLLRGHNHLRINVKGLFYRLPCRFDIAVDAGATTTNIFPMNEELYQIDHEAVLKARSKNWIPTLRFFEIYRSVHESDKVPWYQADIKQALLELRLDSEAQLQMRFQFEVDHRQTLRLMMCRNGRPDLLMRQDALAYPLRAVNGGADGTNGAPAGTPRADLFDAAGALRWNLLLVNPVGSYRPVVFRSGAQLDRWFRREDGSRLRGMVMQGDAITGFPQRGYELAADGDSGALAMVEAPKRATDYRQRYLLTLDETGVLRVHSGEVPYWLTDQAEAFRTEEGRVILVPLGYHAKRGGEAYNPYSGKH